MCENDTVVVPDPTDSDLWSHEFIGRVEAIDGEIVVVSDQDGYFYEIELERLTKAVK